MQHHTATKVETPEGFPYKLPDGNWYQQLVNALLVERGPFFVHPEGSPYLGLPLDQQKELAKMRRPVGRTPTWITDKMRKATKRDYEKLLLACTEALTHAWYNTSQRLDYVNIYVKVPYNYRTYYDKTLPRVFILGYDDWTITVSWRVDSIVDWLYNKGHSPYKAAELRKSVWALLLEQERLDFYYEYAADQSIIELYADIIDDVKNEKIKRTFKGRGKDAMLASGNKPLDTTQ